MIHYNTLTQAEWEYFSNPINATIDAIDKATQSAHLFEALDYDAYSDIIHALEVARGYAINSLSNIYPLRK